MGAGGARQTLHISCSCCRLLLCGGKFYMRNSEEPLKYSCYFSNKRHCRLPFFSSSHLSLSNWSLCPINLSFNPYKFLTKLPLLSTSPLNSLSHLSFSPLSLYNSFANSCIFLFSLVR